jgi:hypothetical protein
MRRYELEGRELSEAILGEGTAFERVIKTRVGETVDPAILLHHQLNDFADKVIHRTAAAQSFTRFDRDWDYYKRGYERTAERPDMRRKGWKAASGTTKD